MTNPLTKTPDETCERIRELDRLGTDIFGTERSVLLESLPWGPAQEWRSVDADWTEDDWEKKRPITRNDVENLIRDYLPTAWKKANEQREGSMIRSISYFCGCLWLIGEDDLLEKVALDDDVLDVIIQGEKVKDMRLRSPYFGKAAYVAISDLVEFRWREHDNNVWRDGDDDPVTADEALSSSEE